MYAYYARSRVGFLSKCSTNILQLQAIWQKGIKKYRTRGAIFSLLQCPCAFLERFGEGCGDSEVTAPAADGNIGLALPVEITAAAFKKRKFARKPRGGRAFLCGVGGILRFHRAKPREDGLGKHRAKRRLVKREERVGKHAYHADFTEKPNGLDGIRAARRLAFSSTGSVTRAKRKEPP